MSLQDSNKKGFDSSFPGACSSHRNHDNHPLLGFERPSFFPPLQSKGITEGKLTHSAQTSVWAAPPAKCPHIDQQFRI